MSDELDELNKQIEKQIEMDRRKKAVQEKDLILKEHRVGRDLDEFNKNQSELEQSKTICFSKMTEENINQLVLENDEYMEASKKPMNFINEEFKKIVPFFRKNLILVGGDTGDGKSTTVANIAFGAITRKNQTTGKSCKVLILTNEEAPEDFYNRITCLVKGWKYANHDQFTDEQRATFKEFIPKWANNGRLTVIGDVYNGIPGTTTTVEGIEGVFNNLLRDYEIDQKSIPDVVIIDYFQNVSRSKIDPKLDEFMCQRKLASLLDQMKLRYPGPIVMMAQMKRLVDEEDTTPFNIRLKGSKLICDKATLICEITPERKLLRSRWKVWKSRFTDSVGMCIYTGYDRGKFVPYSLDFQKNVAKLVERNLEKDKEQELPVINSEEDSDNGSTEE